MDDHDRNLFLDSFACRVNRIDARIVAYCLMGNHFHLILSQTSSDAIARLMHSALTSYVRRFNARHDRYGTLFQGRFKAARIDDANYLRTAIAYVHLNPLDLRHVNRFEDYEFSSHRLFAGGRSSDWFDPDLPCEIFGSVEGYVRHMRFAERKRKQISREISAMWSPASASRG
ncbi:MAG: transposase [Solirubrobacterales bacterium]